MISNIIPIVKREVYHLANLPDTTSINIRMKTFMQMYLECVASDVVGPETGTSEAGEGSQFSSDSYAPGDSRTPKMLMPMITRFGVFGTPKKKFGKNSVKVQANKRKKEKKGST